MNRWRPSGTGETVNSDSPQRRASRLGLARQRHGFPHRSTRRRHSYAAPLKEQGASAQERQLGGVSREPEYHRPGAVCRIACGKMSRGGVTLEGRSGAEPLIWQGIVGGGWIILPTFWLLPANPCFRCRACGSAYGPQGGGIDLKVRSIKSRAGRRAVHPEPV
jgi:hypothetical protein